MVNEKILEEYNTVKNNVGLFDFSIEGKIIIKGEGRIDFINGIVSNDVKNLENFTKTYLYLTIANILFQIMFLG